MSERQKYPDLVNLNPTDQKKALAPQTKRQCGRRNNSCAAKSGGCSYRYEGGNKTWVCPKCGMDRRCRSNKSKGLKTCRMHGAGSNKKPGGRPPSSKTVLWPNMSARYNEILRHPELLDGQREIAALTEREEQLFEELNEYMERINVGDIRRASSALVADIAHGNLARASANASVLIEALGPMEARDATWKEINSTFYLIDRLKNSDSRRSLESKGMVPWAQVVEMTAFVYQLMFKFIPEPAMRSAFSRMFKAKFDPTLGEENGY